MKTNKKNHTALRRAILIGLALSAALGTTAMAAEIAKNETVKINHNYSTEYEKPNDTVKIEVTDDKAIKQDKSDEGTLSITSQGNTISSKDDVAIQINGKKTETADYTLKLDATTGNNIITSEEEAGINSDNGYASVLVTGAGNTINAGLEGIKVNGDGSSSSIELVATGDAGNTIQAGTDGINAKKGNQVFLQAEKGNNQIKSGTSGVTASGEGTQTFLSAQMDNRVTVTGTENGAIGLHAEDGAIQKIESGEQSHFIVSAESGDVFGLYAENGSIVTDEQKIGSLTIEATHPAESGGQGNLAGIKTEGENSNIDLDVIGDVTIETHTAAAQGNGIHVNGGEVDITSEEGSISITSDFVDSIENPTGKTWGINTESGKLSLTAKNDIRINSGEEERLYGKTNHGIHSEGETQLKAGGKITVNSYAAGGNTTTSSGIYIAEHAKVSAEATGLEINAVSEKGNIWGIGSQGSGAEFKVTTENEVNITAKGQKAYAIKAAGGNDQKSTFEINAKGDVTLSAKGTGATYGVYTDKAENRINGKNVVLQAESESSVYGVRSTGQTTINAVESTYIEAHGNSGFGAFVSGATADAANGLTVKSGLDTYIQGDTIALYVTGDNATADISSEYGINLIQSKANAAMYLGKGAKAQLSANNAYNLINSKSFSGVYGIGNDTSARLIAQSNIVRAGEGNAYGYGTRNAVYADDGANVKLEAGFSNYLSGAVYAKGPKTQVRLSGYEDESGTVENSQFNYISSFATISNAGGLTGTKVISALYAENDANIEVKGDENILLSYADVNKPEDLERVVWAYDKADISIDGNTFISTDMYEKSANSNDIAIAAGTATGLTAGQVNTVVDDKDRAHVNLNYGAGSSITGDILAAYAGTVNINAQTVEGLFARDDTPVGISVTGNILAGNNGILNLDIGKGGTLTGRADDYGDAGLNTTEEYIDQGHAVGNEFFNPAFSSTIYKGGEVNLTMGEGSQWKVTGQSWITRINTEAAPTADSVFAAENPVTALQHMATIDLTSEFKINGENVGGHALTVYDMKGDAAFNMKLHANRDVSDMLYMKHAEGNYIINVVDAVTMDDMYADDFNGLRFATVGKGSDVSFRAVTVGEGVFNVEYEVGTDDYAGNEENAAYNGDNLTASKPGDTMVDNFFESEGTPGAATETQAVQTLALTAENAADKAGDETDAEDSTGLSGTTNFKLVGRADEQTSNAGKTVIAMSKVNYSNAVYMDRLNKRMGEARYLTGDDGLWVRMRHDRIGKDDAFRSMNTMFEIGYDWKDEGQKDGTHYRGFAFDYMRGTADYQNVAGDGDVRRAGLWYHDTWLGDAGHYTDYVVKYGRLSNDFDIYSELGEKISGDYDNDVWSVSAEYGRKKDLGNDWYFEPQAQLQYAYVTDASYTTSQGTKVDLDAIDSLIGRAGFRIGRDTSAGDTVYFKADILHEFLGDQDIRARDTTGVLSETYENEGTWYDVGFGFSHRMNDDSYVFLDLEHSFGNDNEDTYQVNIGLSKAF